MNKHNLWLRKWKFSKCFLLRIVVSLVGLLLLIVNLSAQHISSAERPIAYTVSNQLSQPIVATLRGHIGKTLDECFKNDILTQDFNHLVEPFRHRQETNLWQSEFWGKCLTAAVLAYRYKPDEQLMVKMKAAIGGLIATQTKDGYIGNYSKDSRLKQWDIWGMKYCLLGLIDYYELTKDNKSLQAACRLADYLIEEVKRQDGKIANKGNYRGMAASSVLLPVVRLSELSGSKKYLDFAEAIVKQWESPDGPQLISKAAVNVSERFPRPAEWYSPEQGQKAYEMMSCYEGLLELYRLTGKGSYKEAVVKTFDNIQNTEVNIVGSGASAEMWFGGRELQIGPVFHYQETCVTVTWLRLSMSLLKLTGEVRYAEAIEKTYYNALMASLKSDNVTWAKYTPLNGQRLAGSGQCGMNLNCCSANGPRGLFVMPQIAVMKSSDGIVLNHFVDGYYGLKTPSGQRVNITQATDYPASGNIDIRFEAKTPEEYVAIIRIPEWSKQTKLFIKGEPQQNIIAGSYLRIKRKWGLNDRIQIQFDMRGRLLMRGDKQRFFAIMSGPLVLSRDTRFKGTNLGATITPLDENYISLSKNDDKEGAWVSYKADFLSENYKETGQPPISISLCDYASAGNGLISSTFQTWMPLIYNPVKHVKSLY